MIRTTVFATALALSPFAAHADQLLKNPTGAELVAQVHSQAEIPASTDTIKVSIAISLANAIAAVTGYHEEIVGQGASAKTIQLPYDLSADTRWALNDDLNALNALIRNAQSIQQTMSQEAETKNGGPLKPKKEATLDASGNVVTPAEPSDAQIKLNKDLQSLMDSNKPVNKLLRIKRSDLKLGTNAIPGVTLSVLTDPATGIVDP